jgi:hypothetical protein
MGGRCCAAWRVTLASVVVELCLPLLHLPAFVVVAEGVLIDVCCCVMRRFDAGGVSIIDFPDGARQGVGGVVRTHNYTAHLGR